MHGERGETVMHKDEEVCVKGREGSLCIENRERCTKRESKVRGRGEYTCVNI